jgi:hypothetical protein
MANIGAEDLHQLQRSCEPEQRQLGDTAPVYHIVD